MRGDARPYWPKTVYVSADACEDELTKRVLSRLNGVQVVYLDRDLDPLAEDNGSSAGESFSLGKERLMLTRYKGEWLKACPGTSQHVCCNLFIVNPGEGCPLDCTYCYLQTYLKRNPTLKLYTNLSEMLDAVEKRVSASPERLFRVGTGELIDSLVWDELTDTTLDLVPFFARLPNALLELKSKCSYVENLVSLKDEHRGKTVVSWSVNAREITENDEAKTASLDERLDAAKKVVEAGYRVGFHFDPLIHFEGWEDAYLETIRDIFSQVSAEDIAWVSVSSLRYKPDMQRIMIERFPESSLPFGEQFLAKDGKLRYIQPLRFKMLNFVWSELKAISKTMPVYMCMESAAAWRNVSGGPPVAGSELVEVFSKKGRLQVVA